ncbi:hypothetical protein IV52_GL000981 [Fructilactobacillus lindneri DSM 20690 = JCM 11027]|uniref:ABC transmembrane type-1 domain-containing protein n=1 Tax=Fructilactobacillus lindneri DSM 20690 = JCM 11027 TaxID=1122148 RepID=A0A0R2JNF6_9LACO|nr:hypothetical protein IV52_GL000981 [Fructilactobacillus lindneri DSM 20690 = JCM 11027]SJZ88646.1 ABC transporter transmembrane region [Fructilactobacillus lindneri DSM 20690 = JCM 11027]
MQDFKTAVKFFYHYLKPYKLFFFLSVILVIFATAMQVIAPLYMGKAISELANYAIELNKGVNDKSKFVHVVTLLGIFFFLSTCATFSYNWLLNRVTGYATNKMRISLFAKLQTLPIRFFDTHSDGDILSRFTSDIDNITNAMNEAMGSIMANIILFFAIIFMMFKESVPMALVTMSTVPISLLLITYFIKKHVTMLIYNKPKLAN